MARRLLCVVVVLVVVASAAWTQEGREGTRIGIQVGSDTFVGMLIYAPRVEASLKAALFFNKTETPEGPDDVSTTDSSFFVVGTHVGYLFGARSGPYTVSAGVEGRIGISLADLEYDPYIRVGARLALNYLLHRNVLLTGVVHPIWVEYQEIHGSKNSDILVQFPRGSLALTLLF